MSLSQPIFGTGNNFWQQQQQQIKKSDFSAVDQSKTVKIE
jgi:hypothetical protein